MKSEFVATAWNNGAYHESGTGYGLKIRIKDRDVFFKKSNKQIRLKLEESNQEILVNTNKPSFWNPVCRELISKDIGKWLRKNRKSSWKKGHPPKIKMKYLGGDKYKVTLFH